jgi:hypothetical protein
MASDASADHDRHQLDGHLVVEALRHGEVLPGSEGEGMADSGAGSFGGVAAEPAARARMPAAIAWNWW